MIFWLRELLGWALVATGLFVFYIAVRVLLLEGPYIIGGPMIVAVGFIIFRGGLQVLKVALAGRVCAQAQAETVKQVSAAGLRRTDVRS